MERKVGEIFKYHGEWYQCAKGKICTCVGCAFYSEVCSTPDFFSIFGKCKAGNRSDSNYVIFKKLEKVGEPFERNGYMCQEYKTHTYPLLMSGDAKIPTANGFAVIIKKNKEDMEEYKMYDAKEDIPEFDKVVDECLFGKDKLKPFDIQKAKEGKPVCTRDGRKARIICFDRIGKSPVVALVTNFDEKEYIETYCLNGRFNDNINDISDYDLMMLPEKKEGWINIYKKNNGITKYDCCTIVFNTKEEAVQYAQNNNYYITTVKVEWEE